jgi:hypothetical protein
MMAPAPHSRAEQIAREFHETYEALAPDFGYRTRSESAVPWDEVPSGNRKLMIATVTRLLERGAFR